MTFNKQRAGGSSRSTGMKAKAVMICVRSSLCAGGDASRRAAIASPAATQLGSIGFKFVKLGGEERGTGRATPKGGPDPTRAAVWVATRADPLRPGKEEACLQRHASGRVL